MPSKKGQAVVRARLLSKSDSEDEGDRFLDGYLEAELNEALTRREDYIRAVQELTACFKHIYPRASKALQDLLLDDTLKAVDLCDRRRRARVTLAALLEVATAALPRAKAARVSRLNKSKGLSLQRQQNKADSAEGADDCWTDDEQEEGFGQLPLEVVEVVMSQLDPCSLGKAACVCKQWYATASADWLWEPLFQQTFPQLSESDAANGGPHAAIAAGTSWQTAFHRAVREHPDALLRWTSNRVLVGGQLRWLHQVHQASASGPQHSPHRRTTLPLSDVIHVTVAEVIARMLGRHVRTAGELFDSSDSDEDLTRNWRLWRLS